MTKCMFVMIHTHMYREFKSRSTQFVGFFKRQFKILCLIWSFHREGGGNCSLLGYYAASIGYFLATLSPEEMTDMLSRNVGKKLPLLAA
jgi:hypothetical protein